MDNTDKITTVSPQVLLRRLEPKRKIIEKPIGNMVISQLQPFNSTMRLQLRRRGYNTDFLPLKTVIPMYYNEFVAGGKLQPIDSLEFVNNPSFKVRPSDNLNGEITSIHKNYFSGLNDVVYNIIQTFKLSRDKKNSAYTQGLNYFEVMTDEEIVQAKAAEKVQQELQLKLLGQTGITVDDIKSMLMLALGIYLTWLLIDSL